MPIAINGTGTITGVSVGGLPDGIVDTDMLAANAVSAAKLGTNSFVSYAIICDEKTSGTNGGSFTSGDWRTRDLNTEIADPDGIVSISSNQFTLGAGTYLIKWACPSLRVNANQSRLYNVTTGLAVQRGQSNYADSTNAVQNISVGSARVDLSSNTVFEIQHRCASTFTSDGFGTATSFGECIFTVVEIYKEA